MSDLRRDVATWLKNGGTVFERLCFGMADPEAVAAHLLNERSIRHALGVK